MTKNGILSKIKNTLTIPKHNESIINGIIYFRILMKLRQISQYFGYQAGERTVEYPWVLKQVKKYASPGSKVVDIGCGTSRFHYILLALKLELCGLDVNVPRIYNKAMEFTQCNALLLPLRNESIDVIIAISTIEHIGFGSYDAPVHEEGDLLLIKEILQVLQKEGIFIVTGPFSSKKIESHWFRFYDELRLEKIKQQFTIEKEEYYIRPHNRWKRVTFDNAIDFTRGINYNFEVIRKMNGPNALFCYVLRKQ